MYQEILGALFKETNKVGFQEQRDYLASLIPSMKLLQRSYATEVVTASYETFEARACYMMRYFPPYTRPLLETLHDVRPDRSWSSAKTMVRAAFFGSGPAPELHALTEYLIATDPSVTELRVSLLDIATDHWSFPREVCISRLISPRWTPRDIQVEGIATDFGLPWFTDIRIAEAITGSDLVVFQNCLNEIPAYRRATFNANISFLLQRLSPGTFLVFLDRRGYRNDERLADIAATRGTEFEVLTDPAIVQTCNVRDLLSEWPPVLAESGLLIKADAGWRELTDAEDGLLVQNDISYHRLVMRRQ